MEITLEEGGKYFDWDSLWWNLCARRRFAFWVVFTTLCREWRCWPRSLFSLSSRSALGWNALVLLRGEHQSHTTSFLHFLQSERALHEVHKKFLWSDCKCFRSRGVLLGLRGGFYFQFFGLAYGRDFFFSCYLYRWKGNFIVNVNGWRYGSEKMVTGHRGKSSDIDLNGNLILWACFLVSKLKWIVTFGRT